MELDQLIPETVSWTKNIKGESGERSIDLVFREFNLDDEAWLKREFGDKLKSLLESLDSETISRMAYRQLEPNSKREIMKLKFIDLGEDGKEFEAATTGPQKLSQIIFGLNDQLKLLDVLMRTRGLSMPALEKMANEFGEGDLGNALKALLKK